MYSFDISFGRFNRYGLKYNAKAPCRAVIYASDGQSEEFFLQKGEGAAFSSFAEPYTSGGAYEGALKLEIFPLRNNDPEFELISIEFSVVDSIPDKVVYLETERYRLGVNLLWGGGISYLEDKQNKTPGVKNLLNGHDTGRLVQQSYYGTRSLPYECGEFMGNTWPYNPVQGGDRAYKKSKLVDYSVTDTAIYVKSRPRDWGKDGVYTFAYYENVYTIEGDMVRVENAITDYSDYEHPVTAQELPAFYTISYLKTFVFYNGKEPWQDGALSELETGFWAYDKSGFVTIEDGNTETWCAFVDEDKIGVGLYTPNIKYYTSGRYLYDGTKDPEADPTNYVAPLNSFRIRFADPIRYEYLITAGHIDTIRGNFKKHKCFTDNGDFNV